jgi:hypothetical protein
MSTVRYLVKLPRMASICFCFPAGSTSASLLWLRLGLPRLSVGGTMLRQAGGLRWRAPGRLCVPSRRGDPASATRPARRLPDELTHHPKRAAGFRRGDLNPDVVGHSPDPSRADPVDLPETVNALARAEGGTWSPSRRRSRMRACPDGKDADPGIGTLRTAGHAWRVAVGPPAAGGELEPMLTTAESTGELHHPGGGRPNILSEGRHP